MAESWVFGANDARLGRGLNHLPYTAFLDEETGRRRLGVGIGACLLDLARAARVLPELSRAALASGYLNELMALGPTAWIELREALQHLLDRRNKDRAVLEQALLPERILTLAMPVQIAEFTDFYASRDHAQRVGELFRPERPLLENYEWIPIGYHARASSIVVSGTAIKRPHGQRRGQERPCFEPTQKLDYEVELGLWVGAGNALGEPVPINEADSHLFGVSLLNDWSARDIQAWEYQPLGPFLGKNFCTTVSPWVTPMDALTRTASKTHAHGALAYLNNKLDQARGALKVSVRASMTTSQSRLEGREQMPLSEADAGELYWTPAQMVAHHTSNGCNLRIGDLLGTGTISGAARAQGGCLLELTRDGTEELQLPSGETRLYLEAGDEVVLSAWCETQGQMPVRLGECRGTIAG